MSASRIHTGWSVKFKYQKSFAQGFRLVVNALDVLSNMVRQYAAFESYVDVGYVVGTNSKNGVVSRLPFSTHYRKPSLFRFTFRKPHRHLAYVLTEHTVGFDGIAGYQIQQRPADPEGIKTQLSLNLAIAGATGISLGSAHTIGRLLLPQIEGRSVLEMISPRFEREMQINGTACYSIAADSQGGEKEEVWIEKESFHLRKMIRSLRTSCILEVWEAIRINEILEDRLFAIPD